VRLTRAIAAGADHSQEISLAIQMKLLLEDSLSDHKHHHEDHHTDQELYQQNPMLRCDRGPAFALCFIGAIRRHLVSIAVQCRANVLGGTGHVDDQKLFGHQSEYRCQQIGAKANVCHGKQGILEAER
jgi:hypothetical protein